MSTAVLLAVALGVGRVPIPANVMRFPDASGFPGVGARQEATMVTETLQQAGGAMRSTGPGPQQIVARWYAGKLNAAERVSVLLGGAAFHDTALLRVYDDALHAADIRERKAAWVGVSSLVGAMPPLPSTIRDDTAEWTRASDFVRSLGWAVRTRSLIRIWIDSFLAARGLPATEGFAFRCEPTECLRVIRVLAQPEDLPEILYLWPLLDEDLERSQVMRTIEMITLQKLVARSPDPKAPSGEWQIRAGLASVDSWVAGMCRSVDGAAQLRLSLSANNLVGRDGEITAASWFGFLNFQYAPFNPLALERLSDLTGVAVEVDRLDLNSPRHKEAYRRLADRLPISKTGNVGGRRRR